ncbi:MAG: hypothetical protein JXR63_08285 [Spirochaetales bacterium]|nr:hypothetical protein [Spirochaetales bacterium]
MKKSFMILSMTLPFFIFVILIQSFRYKLLDTEIKELEDIQLDVFENNKRLVAEITSAKNPYRVVNVSREVYELNFASNSNIVYISFEGADNE